MSAEQFQSLTRGGKRSPRRSDPKQPHVPVPPGIVTIDLPLPDKVLKSNGRYGSHFVRAKKVKQARSDAAAAALASPDKPTRPWKRAVITPTFYVSGRHDKHNLMHWLKSYLDGLQGVLIEDDHDADVQMPVVVAVPRGGRQGVTLRVQGIE